MFVRVVLPGMAVPVATHEGASWTYSKGHLAQKKDKIKQTGGRSDGSKRKRESEKTSERKEKAERDEKRENTRQRRNYRYSTVTAICHACAFLLREIVRAFPFFLLHRHLDSASSSRGTQETPGSLHRSRTRWDRTFFSTGKCRNASTCTTVFTCVFKFNGFSIELKISREDCRATL